MFYLASQAVLYLTHPPTYYVRQEGEGGSVNYSYLIDTFTSDGSNDAKLATVMLKEKTVSMSAYSGGEVYGRATRRTLPNSTTPSIPVRIIEIDRSQIDEMEKIKSQSRLDWRGVYEKAKTHGEWAESNKIVNYRNNEVTHFKDSTKNSSGIVFGAGEWESIDQQLIAFPIRQKINDMFLLGFNRDGDLKWASRLEISGAAEEDKIKFYPMLSNITDTELIIYGGKGYDSHGRWVSVSISRWHTYEPLQIPLNK